MSKSTQRQDMFQYKERDELKYKAQRKCDDLDR